MWPKAAWFNGIFNIHTFLRNEAFFWTLNLFLMFKKFLLFVISLVYSMECKHIYEKKAILDYIPKNAQARCPMSGIQCTLVWNFNSVCQCNRWLFFFLSGCPKNLRVEKVVHDPLLVAEIEEMRSMSEQFARTNVVEDFTELDEEKGNWGEHLLQESSHSEYQDFEFSTTTLFSESNLLFWIQTCVKCSSFWNIFMHLACKWK